MDSTTMKGTVQRYFDLAFDEMTDKEPKTRLARNTARGVRPLSTSTVSPGSIPASTIESPSTLSMNVASGLVT